MNKFKVSAIVLAVILLFSCASKQIGLKENWIDERDVMALRDMPIKEWIEKAGLPTLVEIIGDTNIYYYNYRPTLYATTLYDSTTFFNTWGSASEQKPSLANKTEVWGSRRDLMQIKVVNDLVISAIITEGPDKKVFVRDLNGNIILDPNSGYNSNISAEQKVNSSFKEFGKIFSSLLATKPAPAAAAPTALVDSAANIAQADSAARAAQADSLARIAQADSIARAAQADSLARIAQADSVARAAAQADSVAHAARVAHADSLAKAAADAAQEALKAKAEAEVKAEIAAKATGPLAKKAKEEANKAQAAAVAADTKAKSLAKDAAEAAAAVATKK